MFKCCYKIKVSDITKVYYHHQIIHDLNNLRTLTDDQIMFIKTLPTIEQYKLLVIHNEVLKFQSQIRNRNYSFLEDDTAPRTIYSTRPPDY